MPTIHRLALSITAALLAGLVASAALAATKTFHDNGNIQSETSYNGDKIAEVRWYDQNGVLQSVEKNIDAQSKVITFFNPKGQKTTEETHVNGKRTKMRTFYPSGSVESEYTLKSDLPDGKYYLYFENGKIKAEYDYKDGKQI